MPLLVDISVDRKGVQRVVLRDVGKWEESKHPRGQPKNKGEFAKKGQSSASHPRVVAKPHPTTKVSGGGGSLSSKEERLIRDGWSSKQGGKPMLSVRRDQSGNLAAAFAKCPQYRGTVNRGLSVTEEDAAKLKQGVFKIDLHSSGTTDLATANSYAVANSIKLGEGPPSNKVPVLLQVKVTGHGAADIRDFEEAANHEVVLTKGMRLRTVSITPIKLPTGLPRGFPTHLSGYRVVMEQVA